MGRKKIAILGGGVGAVTTAFELTSQPDWQTRYDITLYQLGWRLGGKGASGRNGTHQDRIEEHGLHIWLGFYDNAFRLMRACYEELDRPRTAPLATMEQAFKPQSYITLQEQVGNGWSTWNLDMPTDGQVPGTGFDVGPRPIDLLARVLELMIEAISGTSLELIYQRPADDDEVDFVRAAFKATFEGVAHAVRDVLSRATLLQLARRIVTEAAKLPVEVASRALAPLARAIDLVFERVWTEVEPLIEREDALRRLVILLDLGRTVVVGMLRDGVLRKGFETLNEEDFRQWLARHDARDLTLRSAPVRAWYDLVFGFPGGDTNAPGSCEAGTSLNAFMRLALTYKGAIFWEMQAGMGDAVFAPYYEVLRRRGVRFEFFHKVRELRLDPAQESVDAIEIDVQATLAPGIEAYDPLVDVKGLACWPSHPRYEQLAQGDALRNQGVNLESSWADWEPVEQKTLRRGADFDEVVLGIAIGAFPYVARELIESRPHWRAMVESVETVQTLSMQLWLKPDTEGLGWRWPKTVMTAYADPYNTWSDMTHLIHRESWPADHWPFNLAYFCGPMPDASEIPPFTDHAFPERELNRVTDMGKRWLDLWTGTIWPYATDGSDSPLRLNPQLLIDPQDRTGLERLKAQYFRANIDPTERYVLSVPGSTKHRLHPGRSGFDNLYLAGDWTRCGIDAGCVEAATISGLLAAESLSGRHVRVDGNYPLERVIPGRQAQESGGDPMPRAAE